MITSSFISDFLIRTNAKFWCKSSIGEIRTEVNYILKKNYIEDLILSGNFWGGITEEKYSTSNIVVSLTTFGIRLNYVHLAVASIMLQTKKANRVILWLGNEMKDVVLPEMLKRMQQYGLEIYYTTNIRSYKKLIPTLKLCPQDTIITIDDDVIYDVCLLEHLINAHLANPYCIYGTRCHRITMQGAHVAPYKAWDMEVVAPEESSLIMPTGVGGIIYPPNSLDDEVFNENVFMQLCPTTDDIWFKVMSLKKGIMCGKSTSTDRFGKDYIENLDLEKLGLSRVNMIDDVNGSNMRMLLSKYNLSL